MSNNSSCEIDDRMIELREEAFFVVYYVIAPTVFVVGMLGYSMLLYAFYRQWKTESAYGYQFIFAFCKAAEIFFFSLEVLTFNICSGFVKTGCEWYMHNYTLMWFAAHLSIPLVNCFITASLLMSVAMAADRVLAIVKPFVYRNLNHGKHLAVAIGGCFVVSIFINAFECLGYFPDSDETTTSGARYVLRLNVQYTTSTLGQNMGRVQPCLRIASLCLLTLLNLLLLRFLRVYARKTVGGDKDAQKKRSAERVLLRLTVWQCGSSALAILPIVAFAVMSYTAPTFAQCVGSVLGPFADGAILVVDLADVFVTLAVSDRLRVLILAAFPCELFRRLASESSVAQR